MVLLCHFGLDLGTNSNVLKAPLSYSVYSYLGNQPRNDVLVFLRVGENIWHQRY